MLQIWSFLKKVYESISGIGVKNKYNSRLKLKVRLTNQLWLLYTISSLVIDLQIYLNTKQIFHYGFFLVFVLAASSAVIMLNWLHKHNTSIVILFAAAFFGLFFLDSMTQGKAGFAMFYFGGIIGLMFFFGLSNTKSITFLLVFMLICISLNIYTDYHIFCCEAYTPDMLSFTYFINLSLSFVIFIYLSFTVNNIIVKKEGKYYLSYLREKIMKEDIASRSLKEKEVLLSELHHRVKNSLAIIASMLNMQSDKAPNETMRKALLDSKNRVISMSIVHDTIYKNPNQSQIDFSDYCRNITKNIERNFPAVSGKVLVIYNTQPAFLSLNEAVPFGLIYNELITGLYKRIFEKDYKMTSIEVGLTSNDFIELTIVDKGPDYSVSDDFEFHDSAVKAIIDELANQLNARWKYEYQGGIKFYIKFSKNKVWFYEKKDKQFA